MITLTDKVLLVKPTNFGFNAATSESNSFQKNPENITTSEIQKQALKEFEKLANTLKNIGIDVLEFEDLPNSKSPDSIFPNNWFSTHEDGKLFTYPMAVSNRRPERRKDIIDALKEKYDYHHYPLEKFESYIPPSFLEGTGSMVLDRTHKVVYMAYSPRSMKVPFAEFCKIANYTGIGFTAHGLKGEEIYHTNVMMAMGDQFVVIGMDTVQKADRKRLLSLFQRHGKEVIELSIEQVYRHFAGNMIQLKNHQGDKIMVMSSNAYNSLSSYQFARLKMYNDHLIHSDISTIESVGGGSVRCMIAEIFAS